MVNIVVLERYCIIGAREGEWLVVVGITGGRPVGASFDEVVRYCDAGIRSIPRDDVVAANGRCLSSLLVINECGEPEEVVKKSRYLDMIDPDVLCAVESDPIATPLISRV